MSRNTDASIEDRLLIIIMRQFTKLLDSNDFTLSLLSSDTDFYSFLSLFSPQSMELGKIPVGHRMSLNWYLPLLESGVNSVFWTKSRVSVIDTIFLHPAVNERTSRSSSLQDNHDSWEETLLSYSKIAAIQSSSIDKTVTQNSFSTIISFFLVIWILWFSYPRSV